MHVEDSVRARYVLDRAEVVLVLFEQSSHQTGGLRPRSSGDAVLDPNPVVGHPAILTGSRRTRAGFLPSNALGGPMPRAAGVIP